MNILLIYGGKSCEHDISIITASLAKNYFEGNLFCVYIDKDNKSYLVPTSWNAYQHLEYSYQRRPVVFSTGSGGILVKKMFGYKKIPIDYAVNCCHGVNGEDGSVSALLSMSGIKEVESGVIASGVAMDKVLTKLCLMGMGLPVVKGTTITVKQYRNNDWQNQVGELGLPVIIKPATLGSSIGITVANTAQQLLDGLELAFHFDDKVLVEQALQDFYELNCACMSDGKELIVSHVERPVTAHDILTFDDKYIGGAIKTPTVNRVEQGELSQLAQQYTQQIYSTLGMRGVVRVDYLVADNKLYVNEINTIPGSLAYGLFADVMTEKQFGQTLLQQADVCYNQRNSIQYSYLSNVLKNNGGIKK